MTFRPDWSKVGKAPVAFICSNISSELSFTTVGKQ